MGSVCGKEENDQNSNNNMDAPEEQTMKKRKPAEPTQQPPLPRAEAGESEKERFKSPVEQEPKNSVPDVDTRTNEAGLRKSSSEGETEEIGEVVYMGYCMVENYECRWVVELHQYNASNKLRLTLHSEEETHKTFPEIIDLSRIVECTIDQTKVTIRFPKKRLVLFFDTTEDSKKFVERFPPNKMSRLLFSEVAIFCGPQKKALVQLVTFGTTKRFVGKRHGAALLIKTEKSELKHPILSSTTCSSQVRLVGIDEQTKHPIMLQFVTVNMAQTFIQKFSEIIHDLYKEEYVILYSGIVTHNGKTKKIELKQFDDGRTELSIFLRKERNINFSNLPTYVQDDLELTITSDGEQLTLVFRTLEEIENFTQYLHSGLE